jgi:hypothetical protein
MSNDINIKIKDNVTGEEVSLTLIGYGITIKQLLEITKKGADEEQTNLRTSGRKRLFSPLRKTKR